ncbi:LrgB family protein [Acinetobacter sp. BSP-153]|jgi:putative effector of murein hydrolase|uniref:LrgB family protein n=1 Tax=unclassified Acinetobacter TaxID=196816 RepID=UPI000A34C34A|nr:MULTISPECIES: LrgB family protein [unclassified Acinetobacter]OTG58561.1 hypothetical protein B9T36_09390 [Acinetobacter sp. ANC 4204]RGD90605.1 LrgB family protein [Acinetobacter sp. SWAC57]
MHIHFVALICFIGTILAYIWGKNFYQKYPYLLFSPTILIPCLIILCMMMFHIQYDNYMYYSKWLVWMLGPTTVAFAIPIFEYRKVIQQHAFSIALGIIIGMMVGVLSSFYLARLFHFDAVTSYSLMSRSISTPFAMELSKAVGGSVDLVILFTVITGIVGGLLANSVLLVLKLDSKFAQGASLGNAAHGFGTSTAFKRHKEEGVAACLSMVLAGIFMVLFGPSLIKTVVYLLS